MKDKIFSMTKCKFRGTVSEIMFDGVYYTHQETNTVTCRLCLNMNTVCYLYTG